MPTLVMNNALQTHRPGPWSYKNLFNSAADAAKFVTVGSPASVTYSSGESAMAIAAQYNPDGGISSPRIPVPANTTIYQKVSHKVDYTNGASWGFQWKFYNSSGTQVGSTDYVYSIIDETWTTTTVTHTGQATQATAELLWYIETDFLDGTIYINDLYLYTAASDQYGNFALTQQQGSGGATLTVGSRTQANTSNLGAIKQQHKLVVGNRTQTNTTTAITLQSGGVTLVVGSRTQANTSNLTAIKQNHRLIVGSRTQANTSNLGAIKQNYRLVVGNRVQANTPSPAPLTLSQTSGASLTMQSASNRVSSNLGAIKQNHRRTRQARHH
jgi:hypothetical protein